MCNRGSQLRRQVKTLQALESVNDFVYGYVFSSLLVSELVSLHTYAKGERLAPSTRSASPVVLRTRPPGLPIHMVGEGEEERFD